MTQSMRLKLAMVGECTSKAPTISEVATAHLWRLFESQQIALWYDNYRRYIGGVDPHNPDKRLNVTVVAVFHTTGLPQYRGVSDWDAAAQAVPPIIAFLVRCVGLLLQRSTI